MNVSYVCLNKECYREYKYVMKEHEGATDVS